MKAYRTVFDNSYTDLEGVVVKRHFLVVVGDNIVAAYTKVTDHADTLPDAIPGSVVVREFVQMEEEAI